jgi:hypothetical protein
VIAAARQAASGLKPDESGRLDVGRRPGVMYMHVSRDQLRRALLIGQSVVAEAERRGFEIGPIEKSYSHRAGVAISVRGHPYAVEIHEMTDPVPLNEQELERWRRDNRYRLSYSPGLKPSRKHVPNGRLRLSLPHYSVKRANWTEGPRGLLEAKLQSVFAELERRAAGDDRLDEERRRDAAERQRLARIRREQDRRKALEEARLSRLRTELDSWRVACDARAYAAALREALAAGGEEHERLLAWCDWIEAYAMRTDPTLNLAALPGLEDDPVACDPAHIDDRAQRAGWPRFSD